MVRAPLHFHGRIPVPEVAPLTYRDGVTHLELVYELSQYLKHVLHPSLQSTVDQVVADAEQLLSDATAQYVDGVQEFQRIHDAFMSDVNASLIALNDGVVSDLVKDETSRLGEVLREIFLLQENLDDESAKLLRDDTSGVYNVMHNHVRSAIDSIIEPLEQSIDDFQESVDDKLKTNDEKISDIKEQLEATTIPGIPEVYGELTTGQSTVVMVGSSTTSVGEYPREVARHLHSQIMGGVITKIRYANGGLPHQGLNIVNAGVSGRNASNYITDARLELIKSYKPLVVFHGVGSNDWKLGRRPSLYQRQVADMVDRLDADQKIFHVLVHQHKRGDIEASNPYTWDQYKDALDNIAADRNNCVVVDVTKSFEEMRADGPRLDPHNLYSDDSVHLTVAGDRFLGSVVMRELGYTNGSSGYDSGWQKADFVRFATGVSSSGQEPLVYRWVNTGSSNIVSMSGYLQRAVTTGSDERVSIFTVKNTRFEGLFVPDRSWGTVERHRVGTWYIMSGARQQSGPCFIEPNGNVFMFNQYNAMRSSAVYVDLVFRGS